MLTKNMYVHVDDAPEVITPEQYVILCVCVHDVVLHLLSLQGTLQKKHVHDQMRFVEKMQQMMEKDIETVSNEVVAQSLPGNNWLRLYNAASPLLEQWIQDEESSKGHA